MRKKERQELVREAAQQEAEERAARLGHKIGSWRDDVKGRRGQCRNTGCFAHIFISGADLEQVSSPTSLKRKCPYRAVRVQQSDRKVPRF